MLHAYEDKSAEAVCTFAFSAGPTMEPLLFQGRLKVRSCCSEFSSGVICCGCPADRFQGQNRSSQGSAGVRYVLIPRDHEFKIHYRAVANNRSGWEPIFEHEGETLAEMAHAKKVIISPYLIFHVASGPNLHRTNCLIGIKLYSNSRIG